MLSNEDLPTLERPRNIISGTKSPPGVELCVCAIQCQSILEKADDSKESLQQHLSSRELVALFPSTRIEE